MNQKEYEKIIKQDPSVRDRLEFVRDPGVKAGGYWRRIAKFKLDRRFASKAQLEARADFGEVATRNYGKKGLFRGNPIIAERIRIVQKGKKYVGVPRWKRVLDEMRKSMMQVAETVEAQG